VVGSAISSRMILIGFGVVVTRQDDARHLSMPSTCAERRSLPRTRSRGIMGPEADARFLYSIKKEGTPASFRLKTARSTISR
jgi:hypothetical protein